MRTIGVIYHPLLPSARSLAAALEKKYNNVATWWDAPADKLAENGVELDESDVVVTIGGDGTILRAAHETSTRGIPLLGINMGRVGFMSEIDACNSLEQVGSYLGGRTRIEERTMVRSEIVDSDSKPFHALNDIVVGRGQEVRIVDLKVSIRGAYLETYRADALVIATGTGSTGYSLALGGPVMDPLSDSFLLKPVASHMSLQGGLILPRDAVVEITLESSQEAVISADGFLHASLVEGQMVRTQVSCYRTRFLRRNSPNTFYSSLTKRLGMRRESMNRQGTTGQMISS